MVSQQMCFMGCAVAGALIKMSGGISDLHCKILFTYIVKFYIVREKDIFIAIHYIVRKIRQKCQVAPAATQSFQH
jgi:hypothetical protein